MSKFTLYFYARKDIQSVIMKHLVNVLVFSPIPKEIRGKVIKKKMRVIEEASGSESLISSDSDEEKPIKKPVAKKIIPPVKKPF